MHRKLPLAGSVKLIKLLRKEFNGYHMSLLGGPGDYNYLEEIKNAADSPPAESYLVKSPLTVNAATVSFSAESRPAESEYGTPDAGVKIERTKSIEEAMVLLKNSFLNICIDSGLMHLSSLVNPSTYCLFGYSNPANSLPFNNIGYSWSHPDCAPCSFYKISGCDNLKCMDEIDIDAVINYIKLRLK
jgi:ADP-heptose:LPS heptosyltransferase